MVFSFNRNSKEICIISLKNFTSILRIFIVLSKKAQGSFNKLAGANKLKKTAKNNKWE